MPGFRNAAEQEKQNFQEKTTASLFPFHFTHDDESFVPFGPR